MKYSSLLLLVLVLNCKNTFCQTNQLLKIRLPLIRTDSAPFVSTARIVKKMGDSVININNTRDSVTLYKIILIDNPEHFDLSFKEENYLSFLTFKKDPGKLIFDSNLNNDFSDEKIYDRNKDENFIKMKDVNFFIGSKEINTNIFIKPFNSEMIINGNLRKKMGILALPVYRYGNFTINHKNYKITAFNHFENEFNNNNTSIIFYPSTYKLPTSKSYPIWYKPGDTIYINKSVYLFKDINKDGDKINLQLIKVMKQNFGTSVGNYAFKNKFMDVINGKNYELDPDKKYTLMDFWGTWCIPCRQLTPTLKTMFDCYKDKSFDIFGIGYDRSAEDVIAYLKKEQIPWKCSFDQDTSSLIASEYKVRDFPTFILIDHNGKIVRREIGKNGLNTIDKYLKSHL